MITAPYNFVPLNKEALMKGADAVQNKEALAYF